MSDANGAIAALDILYYDCWAEVFKYLNPQDLFNLSTLCKPFKRLLNDQHYGFNEINWKFEAIIPLIMPFFADSSEVLKARICKSWRRSIEEYLEKSDYCPRLTFETTEGIEEFMTRFENSPLTPILARKVCLKAEEVAPYEARATEFMQMFGDLVWNLEITGISPFVLLPFTPNLKSLEYCFHFQPNANAEDADPPNIPTLRTLSILCGNQMTADRVLRAYGPQLEHLKYFGRVVGRVGFADLSLQENGINSQTFGALKTLDVGIRVSDTTYAAFQALQCPLETLKIDVMWTGEQQHLKIDLFLQSIQHLQQIKNLSINGGCGIRISETGAVLAEEFFNANITAFELKLGFGYWRTTKVSWNFLEYMTGLESLILRTTLADNGAGKICHDADAQKSIDFFDGVPLQDIWNKYNPDLGRALAYDSNVWEKVETLKAINFDIGRISGWKGFCFTREEWVLRNN